MQYKPLLLALMLVFSAPVIAADNTANSRSAEVKKQEKNKKEHARAEEGKKEKGKNAVKDKKSDGKEAVRDGKESKKPLKNSKGAEKEADASKHSQREGRNRVKEPEAESKKTHVKPVAESKEKSIKVQTESKQVKKEGKDEGVRLHKGGKKPVKDDKAADKDTDDTVRANKKNHTAKEGKTVRQDKKPVQEKNGKSDKQKAENTDSDELKAAVATATNDVGNKKALLKQSEGLLIHVSTSLKQLQEERIRQERIRQARGSLASVNRKQREAWDDFQKLNADLNRLKTEVAGTKAQISRFVSGNYKNSQPNAVALFLKNAEPGQKNRFLRYTRYVNVSNKEVVKDLEKQQKALAVQEQKINNELARLKKIQANVQSLLKKQGVTDAAEQTESRRQNAKIAKDAQKMVEQKEHEQQLNDLLSNLEKKKAANRIQDAEAKRKLAEARLAAAEKARKEKEAVQQKAEARRAAMSNLTAEDKNIQAPAVMGIGSTNGFGRMQGRLKKPVAGVLTGLFGKNRNGGDVWKGVFYSTAPAPVESIAAGTVSYADELDGYGKVVVVDHGENYISIYSGLSEISVGKGYSVASGSKIGTSGSLPDGEEGLYLQIRYEGQVLNPSSWIR
ncbi:murein hydrolase activator EnvC family protein [Neisseria cinerea]|uniref:Peptidase, M23 family n=1 Tax=Neisseria cinerea ATCC 14685 TaxID=546262 RepID=D0W0F1_NEICI|nr:peptidoglycan DD-metalloendopeptidase family protein [Neisseria cinerea]EEZ72684.1 peptidase, M23 family [Neisseria cinerea ATCC 14685]MCD2071270.1 peptidoglycan DD-metalloendopeptidase family protein [Neisseria cinerea]